MTAKGKVNASKVQVGDRILVQVLRNDAGLVRGWDFSTRKTGDDVLITRVTAKYKAGSRRGYYIEVAGLDSEIYAEPIQTMILAPEDAAGIKRAYLEALAEDGAREPAPTTLAETLPTIEGEPEVPAIPTQGLEFPRVNKAAREVEAATKAPYATLSVLASATDVVHIVPEVTIPGLAAPDGGPVTVPVPAPKVGEDMSPLAVAGTYRVEFDRVGRSRNIPILEVEVFAAETWNTANVLAEKIHAHVAPHLASTWYTIEVDLTYGRVLIQDGRFGEGKATLIRKSA